MLKENAFKLMGIAAILAWSSSAQAVVSFTITDGTVDLTLNDLEGARLGGAGGVGDLRTQITTTPIDHLFQNWFWYRAEGDTREYALSNQIAGTASGNRARLVYSEPSDNGATPNALRIELEYTLTDLASTGYPRALLVIGFRLRNMTDSALSVQFFSYNDLDLSSSPGGEVGVVGGSDDHVQLVEQPTGSPSQAIYAVSSTNHIHYQVGAFPNVLNQLTDAGSTTLTDASASFGPGDHTGANQWGVLLGAAGNASDSLVGSVVIEITRGPSCPADIAPSGTVNTADLLQVINSWGICP
jgi:hypothetical protein